MNRQGPPPSCFLVILIAGLWLITAPASFSFESAPLIYSDIICGILLILLSLWGHKSPSATLLWTLAAVGIWLQFAPLLFWAPTEGAYITNILIGTLVIALSVLLFPLPGQVPDEEPSIPPGWMYNPSSWPQRLPIALFAFLCWTISKYLAANQLGYTETVWDPFFSPGTEAVLHSSVSQSFPVSDAGLGALAYTLEFLTTCQGGKSRWRTAPWGVFIFGILAIPVSIVSTILVILQPLAVGTWCTLCLVTAVCMLIPIPLALDEVIASWRYVRSAPPGKRLAVMMKGGHCIKAKTDTRTPPLTDPFSSLLKASLWGVTFPWNLSLSALFGICLMTLPSLLSFEGILFDLDPIIGALTVIVSILSFSELLRKARYFNCLLALALCIAAFFSPMYTVLHLAFAIAVGLLALRSGPLKEEYAHHSL